MLLEIFNVEHGACSLITTDEGRRVMVDCGHNSTSNWLPGDHLVSQGITSIDLLVVTNYDEDHLSGFCNLVDRVNVRAIRRNRSVSPAAIRALKVENGIGPGTARLARELDVTYISSGHTELGSLSLQAFCNSYPGDFRDENNLSLVTFLSAYGKTLLFPGDIETEGWSRLLEQQAFRTQLARVSVLFASHHGRVSGICEEMFGDRLCRPYYIVISDKHKGFQTQETTNYYRSVSIGGHFRGEKRHVLTTRRDGKIEFNISPSSWGPI